MKKNIILSVLSLGLIATSCRKDEEEKKVETVDLQTQNEYDTEAITTFLKEHYFDSKGNIVAFDEKDTADDNEKPLSDYQPQTLSNGTVYVVRTNAQPTAGKTIKANDQITLMHRTYTYLATKNESGVVKLRSGYPFYNTIDGTGVPQEDPSFFYVKQSVLDKSGKNRNFYEIEGFNEALQHFKSFDLNDDADYNLQGVIIVPSKAAFARDPHFNYAGYSLNDRTFVFNFQVYKTADRTAN
ncbi:hypothetical protein [Riemerella columbina]|uniref:hypothetical protein n=1 Tax=Riemerella columbina TaxID=103810 RepID=UPI0003793C03|nr:hypothetical protein [Riemerella columbina]